MSPRKFVREVERRTGLHLECSTTGGGHLRLVLPCGRSVFAAKTPSDFRNIDNTLRNIRRAQQQEGARPHGH